MELTTAALSLLIALIPTYIIGNAMHETSHSIGLYSTGVKIQKVQFIPNVFAGEFTAYVRSDEIVNRTQALVGLLAPYVLDILIFLSFLFFANQFPEIPNLILCCLLFFVVARPIVSLATNVSLLRCSRGDFFCPIKKNQLCMGRQHHNNIDVD